MLSVSSSIQAAFEPGPCATSSWPTKSTRTPPRTQSTLLEAMNERSTTSDRPARGAVPGDGDAELRGALPRLPLPESQIDRFSCIRNRLPRPEDQRRTLLKSFRAPRRGSGAAPGRAERRRGAATPRTPPSACTSRRSSPIMSWRWHGRRGARRTSRSASRRAARSPGGTPGGPRRSAKGATTFSPTISSRWRRRCWRTA